MRTTTPQELRAMGADKALDIGTAWGALERVRRRTARLVEPKVNKRRKFAMSARAGSHRRGPTIAAEFFAGRSASAIARANRIPISKVEAAIRRCMSNPTGQAATHNGGRS